MNGTWLNTFATTKNANRTILKKINISFIVYFTMGKCRFSLNKFWTHLIYFKGIKKKKYIYIYIYIYICIEPRSPGHSIPGHVMSYQRLWKWYLIHPCLTLTNIRYVSRVKWSNPGKVVVPSPKPQCSSYWKGSLLVTLSDSQLWDYTKYKTRQSQL